MDLAGNRARQQRTEIGIAQVWVSFQSPRQCTLGMHIRWGYVCSQVGQSTIDLAGNRATQQITEIGITQVWVSFSPPDL